MLSKGNIEMMKGLFPEKKRKKLNVIIITKPMIVFNESQRNQHNDGGCKRTRGRRKKKIIAKDVLDECSNSIDIIV